MNHHNNASLIRRELYARVARLALEGRLEEGIERMVYEMTSGDWETIRCCIHHDRAILRLRAMALLGADPAGLEDADRPLADYARSLEAGTTEASGEKPVLTIIDEACNACVKSRYLVTEACQGCLARPCKMNCPRKAIRIQGGRASIDAHTCVNCGLCLKNCPYTAIVKIPVPCEEACPVGAIAKGEGGLERIDAAKCILCGKCLKECPFGAVAELSSLARLSLGLAKGSRLVALVAPAITAQFPGGIGRLAAGLSRLGFEATVEVARGAEECAEEEAAELAHAMAEGKGYLATSCCPAWVGAARTRLSPLAPRVSTTPSPLAYTVALSRREHPDCQPVFIGPCVAKRAEARGIGGGLLVITGEELAALFSAAGIQVAAIAAAEVEMAEKKAARAGKKARGFAASGGAGAAILAAGAAGPAPRVLTVDGLSKQQLRLMEGWAAEPPAADLVEVMACEGGCVGGPCLIVPRKNAKAELERDAART